VEILRKQRQALTGLEVAVDGEQDTDPPWTYRRLTLRVVARGHHLDERRVRAAVRLSLDRYCSVVSTIRGITEIVEQVDVVEEPPFEESPVEASPAPAG
jgi:putative redox protein